MRALRIIASWLLMLGTGSLLFAAGDDLKDLRAQLAAAEEKTDKPAVAEISRRILEGDPRDQAVWEKRVRALLELGDLERCKQALDQWEQPGSEVSIIATELSGDLAFEQKNYDEALRRWSAYLALKPDADGTLKKIAWVYELQTQWDKAADALTKLIALEDSAGARVWRARCDLELRKWDAALADMAKANEIDASDEAVKQWLPQFETLQKSLPEIRVLDKKIAANSRQPALLLDRGLLCDDAQRYDLALEDAEAALKIAPESRRALLQKGYALLSLHRAGEAAKLHMVVKETEVTDETLHKIDGLDAKISAKPDAASLTERARLCSDLEQYALAWEDADAAVTLDPRSADALVERGFASMKLGHPNDARPDFVRATELNPKNFVAWRSLGELEMERADYPAAIDFFTRSLKLHESPLVLQKREKCYRNSGHDREADQDLQRFQKLTAQKKK